MLSGIAVLVTVCVLGGRQVAVALAADEPAAAGAAQPAGTGQAAGRQGTPSSQTKSTGRKTKGDKSAKPRGRLPAYFSGIVTDEQRNKIYAIQKEFEPKIKELTLKLNALKKEQDDRIDALLTPEQKKQIEERKAAAKQAAAARQAKEKRESTESKGKEGGAKPTPPAPKPEPAKPKPEPAK